jgi:hypothetical protein
LVDGSHRRRETRNRAQDDTVRRHDSTICIHPPASLDPGAATNGDWFTCDVRGADRPDVRAREEWQRTEGDPDHDRRNQTDDRRSAEADQARCQSVLTALAQPVAKHWRPQRASLSS